MGDKWTFLEAERANRKTLSWRGSWHVWGAFRNKSSVADMSNIKTVEQDVARSYEGLKRIGPKRPDE